MAARPTLTGINPPLAMQGGGDAGLPRLTRIKA